MHSVHTRIRFTLPSTKTLTRWRLGLNTRLLLLSVFLPAPFFFFANPRRLTDFPDEGLLPQSSHRDDMFFPPYMTN